MTSQHRKLRRHISEAIPRDWRWRRERGGHWVDPTAKWRADVLAAKDECVVALEAQLQYEGISRRSEAILKSSVWPIWIFPHVPRTRRALPLLEEKDLLLLPHLLAELHTLPSPSGLTWETAQPVLHAAIDAANRQFRAALTAVLAEPPPEAPP